MAIGGGFFARAPQIAFPGKMVIGLLVIAVGVALPFIPWPALAKTLLVYAYAARIPVAMVMFFAIQGNWGTHYGALPRGFPRHQFLVKIYQDRPSIPIGLLGGLHGPCRFPCGGHCYRYCAPQ